MTYFRKLYGPRQGKKSSKEYQQYCELYEKVVSLSQKISQSLFLRSVKEIHKSEANPYLWHMMEEVLNRNSLKLLKLVQARPSFHSLDRSYISQKLQECVEELDYCCVEFYQNDNDFVNVIELL